jgi:acetyl-CoA C-acetyltransferase
VLSRHISGAAERLSATIGASPRFTAVSGIGGNSPQAMVSTAAAMIARGELDSVLIAGGETYYPRAKRRESPDNALFQGLVGGHEREDMVGATPEESLHGITLPIHGFPLFETALWAESGLGIDEYRLNVGKLWSGFSEAAANHPYGWTSRAKQPAEIITPSAANRWIAFPYTKFMNPLIYVDLGAAIILTSVDVHGVRSGRRPVYFRGGATSADRQTHLVQRTSFSQSPPLRAATNRALDMAGLTLEEIDCFDLYSCFPCAIAVAQRMLGLPPDERRPLTLTGGLGFFGGPGNNYSLHAVATLADAIASGEVETGMVTGLSWFMQKHSVGIYGSTPTEHVLDTSEVDEGSDQIVGDAPMPVTATPQGRGRIDTYTVLFARDGTPTQAIVYGSTDGGERFVANTGGDPEVYDELMSTCQVGRIVRVRHRDSTGMNLVELADDES